MASCWNPCFWIVYFITSSPHCGDHKHKYSRVYNKNTSFYVRQILWIKKKFIELLASLQTLERHVSLHVDQPILFISATKTTSWVKVFFTWNYFDVLGNGFRKKWNWINRPMLNCISIIDIRFKHELELLSNDAFNQIDCIEVNSVRHWKPFRLTRTNDNLCLRFKHGNNNR